MGLVTPSQVSPNDEITAASVNDPINQIAAVVNGNIEAANIANNALTTNKIADNAITPTKMSVGNDFTYSTTEQDTGRKWIDGRAVYRKVITTTVNLTPGDFTIATGISGLSSSSNLLDIKGYVRLSTTTDSGTAEVLPIYREPGQFLAIRSLNTSTGSLLGSSTFTWGNSYFVVIIEYVK